LYHHPCVLARWFFWQRLRVIHRHLCVYAERRESCIDFGCGSGTFLPTLAGLFSSVVGVDMETVEAERLLEHYPADNVKLRAGDARSMELEQAPADVVVAADVLEHFPELGPPAATLRRWLKDDGWLFTSVPTENLCTRLTRLSVGWERPEDHYHAGRQVERFLAGQGFSRLTSSQVAPLFPLYIVSVWRKRGGG
jgi:2-polyprenyl-3-methyl-5-hydroxy-6-metoxy-1,4-benzoquinol methylase